MHARDVEWNPGSYYGSVVFKELLKQQSHDAVSDPDFRDDRRVRQELNQSMFCYTLYVPI